MCMTINGFHKVDVSIAAFLMTVILFALSCNHDSYQAKVANPPLQFPDAAVKADQAMERIVIPEFAVENAFLPEIWQKLMKLSQEFDSANQGIGIIYYETEKMPATTLRLYNKNVKEIVEIICQDAGLRWYADHAVIVLPESTLRILRGQTENN